MSAPAKYSRGAIALHWAIAALVVAQLGLGKFMTELEDGSFFRFELTQLHKSIGIAILLLTLFRIGWRLAHPVPGRPAGLKNWEEALRKTTHIGFYVLLILLPLSGWAHASASPLDIPTTFFGLFEWPHLPWLTSAGNQEALATLFQSIHKYLGFGMILLFLIHMAGIAKHTFILRDGTLKRMLP